MHEIIPGILEKDYDELKNKIALVRGVVPVAQIDLCDGVFVPSRTWPFSSGGGADEHLKKILNEQEGMPFWEDIDFELDLMVADAVENFDLYAKLGAKRIIFHLEAVKNLEDFKNFLEGIDAYVREMIQIGIAINPSTSSEKLFPLIPYVDFVQYMGNDKMGYHGVELDEQVYKKIEILRKKYIDLPIAVDIGVNMATAPLLIKAGATRLVAGSAIFNSNDIINTINRYRNL